MLKTSVTSYMDERITKKLSRLSLDLRTKNKIINLRKKNKNVYNVYIAYRKFNAIYLYSLKMLKYKLK